MPRPERKQEKSAASVRDVRQFLTLSCLLVVAVLVVYLQSTDFEFVSLDDPTYVSDNSHVKAGLSASGIAWSFDAFHDGNWIPFTWLSLMLDSSLHGTSPGGYHLTNVLLHAANCVLLFAFLAWATGNSLRSAFAAALFAIHPLHAESVAWVTERKDVLSIFFGLLSLLAYVDYAKRRRPWSLGACFALFTCSLLSKQTLVTLPFLFLLLDYWPLQRFKPASEVPAQSSNRQGPVRLLTEKLPFFAASAVFSVVVVFAQKSSEWNSMATPARLRLATRLMNAVVVYAEYLRKMVFPRHLVVFYSYHDGTLTWSAFGVAAVLLAGISVFALIFIRRWPFLFVGWAWYLGTLVPMIGIVQVGGQQMADRYTYFPLIGVYLAVTWLVCELAPQGVMRGRVLPAAGVAALCALAVVTFIQVGDWRDSVTLFRHAHDCEPDDPFIRSMLGSALVSHDQVEEGLALVQSAAQIPPPNARAHFGLGVVLQKIGRLDEAAAEYRRAIEIDDSNPETQSNLAFILATQGKDEDARQHLLRAIQIDPSYPNSYGSLAYLCMKSGKYADAVKYCQDALRLDPNMIVCRQTLAAAFRALGRNEEAQRELDQVEALEGSSAGS